MELMTIKDTIEYHLEYLCRLTPSETRDHCLAYSEQGFCWIGKELTIVQAEFMIHADGEFYPDYSFMSNRDPSIGYVLSYEPVDHSYHYETFNPEAQGY